MYPVTASTFSTKSHELNESIDEKKIEQKISRIEKEVDELSKLLFQAKQVFFWREQNTSISTDLIRTKLAGIGRLLEGVYCNFSRILNFPALLTRISKIRQIEASCLHMQRALGLVLTLEHQGMERIYEIISQVVETLLRVINPEIPLDEKLQILEDFERDHIRIAEDSPRDVGIELLKLLEMAIDKVILQNQESQNMGALRRLHTMRKSINEKLMFKDAHSPRFEKDHPSYSSITDEEVNSLLSTVSECKKKYLFWSKLGTWKKIVGFVKKFHSEVESVGDRLEQEHGLQITGMGIALENILAKIIRGEYQPSPEKELERQLDVFANAYMQCKGTLEVRRNALYLVTPDESLKAVLTYSYGLRHELSEVGFLLEMVRELAKPEVLAIFSAQAILLEYIKSQNAKSEKEIAQIMPLFQVGELLRTVKETNLRSDFADYVKRSLTTVRDMYMQCVREVCKSAVGEQILWDEVAKGVSFSNSFEYFFLSQMLVFVAEGRNELFVNSNVLLLYTFRQQQLQRPTTIERVILEQRVFAPFDRVCAGMQITDLLEEAHAILTGYIKIKSLERNVCEYAKVVQLFLEFSNKDVSDKDLAVKSIHTILKKELFSKLCELTITSKYPCFGTALNSEMVRMFEMVCCCLYGRNLKEKADAYQYVYNLCENKDLECTDDLWYLLYVNTIEKIINNSFTISPLEYERLVNGPVTAYVRTKKTIFDETKMQVVVEWLLEREVDMPEDQQKITKLMR